MRQERTVQASLFDLFAGHEIGRELKAMSAWLDGHRELLGLVAADLRRHDASHSRRSQSIIRRRCEWCVLCRRYPGRKPPGARRTQ